MRPLPRLRARVQEVRRRIVSIPEHQGRRRVVHGREKSLRREQREGLSDRQELRGAGPRRCAEKALYKRPAGARKSEVDRCRVRGPRDTEVGSSARGGLGADTRTPLRQSDENGFTSSKTKSGSSNDRRGGVFSISAGERVRRFPNSHGGEKRCIKGFVSCCIESVARNYRGERHINMSAAAA